MRNRDTGAIELAETMEREALFRALERSLMEDLRPSIALEALFAGAVPPEFEPLRRMKTTAQSPVHHPEGNVWNHTMLVVDEAAKRRAESKDPAALMWAALLHDVGKPDTTRVRRGKITSYGHETLGAELARRFLQRFSADQDLIGRVCALIRYHMQVLFVGKGMPFADVNGMRENADLEEVALLGLCDRMGRLNADAEQEAENIRIFLERCGR
ncbi:HDIG domain-containing protein [Flavonifractor sp. DFI.6.63]|uniref:HDIG domain-containing metalloprotein n=1 Tax=Oscillospiraceae TaxID=216572 RepID=UPI00210A5F16|nr:HDIG domain-containing metalloprotein [Flavonifractor sp. DFI.6.63]MCQ5028247.1 HDIG domain-containing protein [Flavonifractor sp. DFI.6.63]